MAETLVIAGFVVGMLLLLCIVRRGHHWHFAKIQVLWVLEQAILPLSVNRLTHVTDYTHKEVTKILQKLLKEHLVTDVTLDEEIYYVTTQEGREWFKEHSRT